MILCNYKEHRKTIKRNKKLPYPIVIVLYHGKISWEHLPEMDELIDMTPAAESGLLKYPSILIDLSVISPENFKGHPVLQVVLEMLQLASEKRLTAAFDRVIDRLAVIKNDLRMPDWLKSFARYTMSVAKIGTEQIAKAFSKILNEKEATDMAKTTAEELWVGGKAEGKAGTVLMLLRTKFRQIPQEVETAVYQMTDPIALDSLAAHVLHSETLDEFTTALK